MLIEMLNKKKDSRYTHVLLPSRMINQQYISDVLNQSAL